MESASLEFGLRLSLMSGIILAWITLNDGKFAEWNNVTPLIKDPAGDAMHCNFRAYGPS
jgi:hypothetical protein